MDEKHNEYIMKFIAGEVAKSFERGTSPFIQPKAAGAVPPLPINPTSNRVYNGFNMVWLATILHQRGLADDPRCCTGKQAERLNAQVKPGEHATYIQRWQFQDRKLLRDGSGHPVLDAQGKQIFEVVDLSRPVAHNAYIYHASQIDGLPPYERPTRGEGERHADAEKLLRYSGAAIFHDARSAHYDIDQDAIHLPPREQFASLDEYYGAAVQQLAAWTGHHNRMGREEARAPLGSREHAKETLRTTLATYMICSELGLAYPGAPPAHVKQWAEIINTDPSELVRLAKDAQETKDFIYGLEREQTKSFSARFSADLERNDTARDTNGNLYERIKPGQLPDVSGHAVRIRPFDRNTNTYGEAIIQHGEPDQPWSLAQATQYIHAAARLYQPTELTDRIHRHEFKDPERSALQQRLIDTIEQDPQPFFARYEKLENSFEGRFVNSDLFKMTIPEYAESREARERFNLAVHNSCAVLADEQFKRVLDRAKQENEGRQIVYLLTGAPGAGKSSFVLNNSPLKDPVVHAVYEGQMSNPDVALKKTQAVLDAGLTPVFMVIHTKPEQALDNAVKRFEKIGRVTSLDLIANLQGKLCDSLKQVHEKFGDKVQLEIYDNSDYNNSVLVKGWDKLNILEQEGGYEQIREKLIAHIDANKDEISERAYAQFRPGVEITPIDEKKQTENIDEERDSENNRRESVEESIAVVDAGTAQPDHGGSFSTRPRTLGADEKRSGIRGAGSQQRHLSVGTWLVVPRREEGEAVLSGARWHDGQKRWFAPAGTDALAVAQWISQKNDRKTFVEDLELECEGTDSKGIKWAVESRRDKKTDTEHFVIVARDGRKKVDHPFAGQTFDSADRARCLIMGVAQLDEPKLPLSTQAHFASELCDPSCPVAYDAEQTQYRLRPPGFGGEFGYSLEITRGKDDGVSPSYTVIVGEPNMPGMSREEAIRFALGHAVFPEKEQGIEDVALPEKPIALPAEQDTPLTLPYEQQELAAQIGAQWNTQDKTWIIPKGGDLLSAAQWLTGSELRDRFIGGIEQARGFQEVSDNNKTIFQVLRPNVNHEFAGYALRVSQPPSSQKNRYSFFMTKKLGFSEEPGYSLKQVIDLAMEQASLSDGLKPQMQIALLEEKFCVDAQGRKFEWHDAQTRNHYITNAAGEMIYPQFDGAFVSMINQNGIHEQIGSDSKYWTPEDAQATALHMADLPIEHGVNAQPIILHELAKFGVTVDTDGNVCRLVEDKNDKYHVELRDRQGNVSRFGDTPGQEYGYREALLAGTRLALEHTRNAPMPHVPVADKFHQNMDARGMAIDADDKLYQVMDAIMYREQGYKGMILEVSKDNAGFQVFGSKEEPGWDKETCKAKAFELANLAERGAAPQEIATPEQEFSIKLEAVGLPVQGGLIMDGTHQIVSSNENGQSKKIGVYCASAEEPNKIFCEYWNNKLGTHGILRYSAHQLTPEYKEQLIQNMSERTGQLSLFGYREPEIDRSHNEGVNRHEQKEAMER